MERGNGTRAMVLGLAVLGLGLAFAASPYSFPQPGDTLLILAALTLQLAASLLILVRRQWLGAVGLVFLAILTAAGADEGASAAQIAASWTLTKHILLFSALILLALPMQTPPRLHGRNAAPEGERFSDSIPPDVTPTWRRRGLSRRA